MLRGSSLLRANRRINLFVRRVTNRHAIHGVEHSIRRCVDAARVSASIAWKFIKHVTRVEVDATVLAGRGDRTENISKVKFVWKRGVASSLLPPHCGIHPASRFFFWYLCTGNHGLPNLSWWAALLITPMQGQRLWDRSTLSAIADRCHLDNLKLMFLIRDRPMWSWLFWGTIGRGWEESAAGRSAVALTRLFCAKTWEKQQRSSHSLTKNLIVRYSIFTRNLL